MLTKSILALSMSLSPVAIAENATTCFVTASVGESIAKFRDEGVLRENVGHVVQMGVDAEMYQPALTMLIEAVYDAPDVAPSTVYSRVLQTCTAESIPM